MPPRPTMQLSGAARRWRLAQALAVSGILHTAVVGGILGSGTTAPQDAGVFVIDLAGAGQAPVRTVSTAGSALVRERRPVPAVAPASISAGADSVDALVAERDELAARLDAERDARARLDHQVSALAAETAALSSALSEERERAARLERSLAEQAAAGAASIEAIERRYSELLAALQDQIAQKDVALRRAREGVTVSIGDRVLFPSGQATLTTEGRAVIDRIATVLSSTPARRIVVEGHTDDVPIGVDLRAQFSSNWELSTARATEVVRALVARGVPAVALEAVGRADTRPVATNDTEAGRRRNRRIEIILSGPEPPVDPADADA